MTSGYDMQSTAVSFSYSRPNPPHPAWNLQLFVPHFLIPFPLIVFDFEPLSSPSHDEKPDKTAYITECDKAKD
jgi:hypothetical protein